MIRLFTDHPRSVGESYLEHLRFACTFGTRMVTGGLACFFHGFLPFLFQTTGSRTVLGLHATWLVNSATHMWGTQRFLTKDTSKNSFWVAMLTFGEGWHNNHHAHPTSARHGLAWYELDITWLQIRFLQWIGVARSVKIAKVTTRLEPEQEAA